jgi:hypothetical protein
MKQNVDLAFCRVRMPTAKTLSLDRDARIGERRRHTKALGVATRLRCLSH